MDFIRKKNKHEETAEKLSEALSECAMACSLSLQEAVNLFDLGHVSEESLERMLENEYYGLLRDVQNLLDITRGYH